MKLIFVLAALAAVVAAKEVPRVVQGPSSVQAEGPENTAYGYLTKYGVPAAEARRKAEEKLLATRIAGGEATEPSRVPYQAGIIINIVNSVNVAVCGGTLLTTNRVVTAAHCYNDGINLAAQFTIVLGSNLLFSGGTRVLTNMVITHWNWQPQTVQNDIAVAYMPFNIAFSDDISPARLPIGSEIFENFENMAVTASGFGLTSDSDTITTAQALSYVNLLTISNTACALGYPSIVQANNICTSGAFGDNTCPGDSGGPIVINRNNERVLIGVNSYGSALGCTVGLPAVHTRVTSYINFIVGNL